MKHVKSILGLSAGVAMLTGGAFAQADIPCDTARLVVPYGAGGGSDLQARVLAESYNKLGFEPKLQVINITGQGGSKGASEVQKSDPNGCTMLFQHEAILASYLTGRVDFSWDDFAPAAMINVEPAIFAASPNAPFEDFASMVSYAKEHEGDVLAAASIASNTHFILLQLQDDLGINFNIIGYEGGRERVTALLSDTVHVGQVGESDARQYFPDQLTALAIFSKDRSATLPDVPTVVEQGFDIEINVTRGIMLPKETPEETLAIYGERFAQVVQDPDVIEAMTKMGASVRYMDSQDYSEWWATQGNRWETVAKEIGIYRAK